MMAHDRPGVGRGIRHLAEGGKEIYAGSSAVIILGAVAGIVGREPGLSFRAAVSKLRRAR